MDELTEDHLRALVEASEADCLPESTRELLTELSEFVTSTFARSYRKLGLGTNCEHQTSLGDAHASTGQESIPLELPLDSTGGEIGVTVERLVGYWQRTYKKGRILEKHRVSARGALLSGFSEAELVRVLDLVRVQPGLIKRKPFPDLTTVFRSPDQIGRLLGRGGTREGKKTWLTPFADAWLAQYQGKIPFGVAAKELWPLVSAHGHAKVLEHFRNWVVATPAAFASIPRFSSTFGSWSAPGNSALAASSRPIKVTVQ